MNLYTSRHISTFEHYQRIHISPSCPNSPTYYLKCTSSGHLIYTRAYFVAKLCVWIHPFFLQKLANIEHNGIPFEERKSQGSLAWNR